MSNFPCMEVMMESEETKRVCTEGGVRELQATLFPLTTLQLPRLLSSPGSFLGNFLLKSNQLEIGEERPGTGPIPRLKEPRDLFALSREVPCPAQAPRWPTECQVLDERTEHIQYSPPTPEQYYVSSGKEVQPKPMGEEFGTVVFQYYPVSAINYFNRSCVGGSKYLQATPPDLDHDDLRFESRFESGNLAKAIKLTATFYELYLRTDMYTNRHTQWFYFRINNAKRHVLYRFSIVNLSKGDSLYNSGMKPLMYSTKDAKLHSIGWRRCGDSIIYFCNDNGNPEEDQPSTYTLTFTVEFPHDKDVVYLAHSYPYTYSDLQDYLTTLASHPVKSTFSTLRLLCRSLAGNNVYYITITSPNTPLDKKKKAVVITARVHPGETPSSWMMKGFLDFLTGDTGPARELREKFIFKLVPMINPDGVIVGNSRCSLTGRDLNRQYRTVIRETYPPIWHIKLMIRRLMEECGVAMYCDLHAHSRQNNIFIYGCENRRGFDRHLHEQVFPLMLHKNAADKFSFENCKFRVQRCKEGAGRVVMWMMGIGNSFTMEASFAGSDLGPRADTHFNTQDYEMMGRAFCQTLLDFYDDAPTKEKLRCKIIKRLLKEGSTADEPTNITLSDYSSDEGDSSSSEEGGGREHYSAPPVVPPPSPILNLPKVKKKKPGPPPLTKQIVTTKSPTLQRKTLPMYQATLGLSLADDCGSSSTDSNSDYESAHSVLERPRAKQRRIPRRKPRKNTKVTEHSDTEIQVKKHSRKSLTVLELLPAEKMRSQSWNRFAGFPQSRTISHIDGRTSHNTTRQLAEVQAKLLSLRHRIWTGMNDGDNLPLSWGFSSYSSTSLPRENRKKKHDKKKAVTFDKSETDKKKEKKKSKNFPKEETRKTPKKKQNGIKRQSAVDLSSTNDVPSTYTKGVLELIEKKGKSLDMATVESCNEEDKKKKSKKKKKHKNKWEKKVKNVVNANVFIEKTNSEAK